MFKWCENVVTLSHTESSKILEAIKAFSEGRLLSYLCPMEETGCAGQSTTLDVGLDGAIASRTNHSVTFHFGTDDDPPIEACQSAYRNHGFEIDAVYQHSIQSFAGEYRRDSFGEQHSKYDAEYVNAAYYDYVPARIWTRFLEPIAPKSQTASSVAAKAVESQSC